MVSCLKIVPADESSFLIGYFDCLGYPHRITTAGSKTYSVSRHKAFSFPVAVVANLPQTFGIGKHLPANKFPFSNHLLP